MPALSIQPPFPVFADTDGQPLEDGYILIGAANLDPQGNPIAVYWDAALTIPAPQPIRTTGGYPSRSGTPANLYANADYSIRVLDKNGSVVYSAPNQEFTSSDQITFVQAGAGAVERTVQSKLRDIINALDFGADPTGAIDATTALQSALTAAAGKTLYVPDGSYTVTTMLTMSSAGSSLVLSNNATINFNTPNYAALKITAANCSVSGGLGGGFVGPASWDGANVAPSYGVVWITANQCSAEGVRFFNVRKVGIWAKDVEDCTVSDCLIEGNYPSGSWTGVETGHWGVVFDPSAGASGGNFKLLDNTIKTCVQGCQPGNYGVGGVVRGFAATGNLFESCWNHGIYSNFTNGATITGNNFNRCQIPVVISGDKNVVSGNAMFTAVDTIGDERDVLGISVRDGSYNVISGNTLKGVLNYPTNAVGINIQDVSGLSDLVGNVVSNNTIDIADGLGVAIRISAGTKTCSGNTVIGNVIRASGVTTEGVIGVYGPSGKVGGFISGITKANPGVITTTLAHGLSANDLVTILDVQGMTQINNTYRVNTTPSGVTFTVKAVSTGTPVDTSGFSTWTSGGEVRLASVKNVGNKVSNNVVIAKAQTFGVYLINQTSATVLGNTVEWKYSAGAPVVIPGVALFDCYRTAAANNAFVIRLGYGTNVSIQGFREYGATVTVQVANNSCTGNINQIDTALGAVFQSVESLSGSGLVVDVASIGTPSLPCAIGSIWRKLDGGVNATLYVKQSGTDGSGWAPVGVGPANASAADIASKTASINTSDKYTGKLVWDTTNNRLLRAGGATDVSPWYVVDGSVTVTPA